jgi:hypothetical protein
MDNLDDSMMNFLVLFLRRITAAIIIMYLSLNSHYIKTCLGLSTHMHTHINYTIARHYFSSFYLIAVSIKKEENTLFHVSQLIFMRLSCVCEPCESRHVMTFCSNYLFMNLKATRLTHMYESDMHACLSIFLFTL